MIRRLIITLALLFAGAVHAQTIIPGGGAPSGAAGGDLGGSYPNPTVLNAGNINSGVLSASHGGAGSVTGALQADGSGNVTQASASNLSNGVLGSGVIDLVKTPGALNTFIGTSGNNSTTGSSNTAQGASSLQSNTTGSNNAAQGVGALANNTTGNYNTAQGVSTLASNTTGGDNTAHGANALQSNTTGSNNTAHGFSALQSNTTGSNNTAQGLSALANNTTAVSTLGSITGGSGYTNGTYSSVQSSLSSGSSASTYPLLNITVSGGAVTAVALVNKGVGFRDTSTVLTVSASLIGGTGSGFSIPVASLSAGQNNTALGYQAGYNGSTSLQIGTNNTYIGYNSTASADGFTNSTALGAGSSITGSNQVVLGNASVTGLYSSATSFYLGSASDLILTRPSAATFQLGAADAASPVAQTLQAQSVVAGTSNTAGVLLKIRDSAGTGSGVSGGYEFDYHPHGAAATVQNTAVFGMKLNDAGTFSLDTAVYASCTALTTNSSGDIGCTASDPRLKNIEGVYKPPANAIGSVVKEGGLISYTGKVGNPENVDTREQAGFNCWTVEKYLPRATHRDAKGYCNLDPNAMLAAVFAAEAQDRADIVALKARIVVLEHTRHRRHE